MSRELEVVVIGAGVAGLAAATRLAESGIRPLVLEAAPIPGGRARSWTDAVTGDVVDNGQHLLMGCYRETLAFLERIGTRHLVAFQDRLRVDFAADGWRGSIDCPPLPGSLSLLAGLALYSGLTLGEGAGVLHVLRDAASRKEADTGASAAGGLQGGYRNGVGSGESAASRLQSDSQRGNESEESAASRLQSDSQRGNGSEESAASRLKSVAQRRSGSGKSAVSGLQSDGQRGNGSEESAASRLKSVAQRKRGSGKSALARLRSDQRSGSGSDESAEAYLRRLNQSERARRAFWDPFIFAALNEDPKIASALTLRRVLDLALMNGPEASRLGWSTVGLGELYAPASEAYLSARGAALRSSSPVLRVEAGSDAAAIMLRDGETLHARVVILAVPPAALLRLIPKLADSAALRGIAGLTSSPILGVNLWLDRSVVDVPFVGLLGTRLHWLFDKAQMMPDGAGRNAGSGTAPPAGAGSHLTLVASGARDLVEQSPAMLIRTALDDLRTVFPRARGAKLLHASVVKEREATTSPAIGWEALRPQTRTSERSVLLAGDWISTGLPATIESAVKSGHLAAEACLSGS